jgi:hypothetical protein
VLSGTRERLSEHEYSFACAPRTLDLRRSRDGRCRHPRTHAKVGDRQGIGLATVAGTHRRYLDRQSIVPEEGPIIKLLDGESLDGPWEDRVYSSGTGPVRHLRFPVQIERNPLYWERASDLPGASNAKWTTLAAARS